LHFVDSPRVLGPWPSGQSTRFNLDIDAFDAGNEDDCRIGKHQAAANGPL
jgi:hypothetical protein